MKVKVKSYTEIRKTLPNTLVYFNKKHMEKFCGKVLDMELGVFVFEEAFLFKENKELDWWFSPLWVDLFDESLRDITDEEHEEIFKELVQYSLMKRISSSNNPLIILQLKDLMGLLK